MTIGIERDTRDMNTLSDEAFRLELRTWIESHYPPGKRFLARRLAFDEIADWFGMLSAKGWLAPGWPREWGGMGLGPAKYVIYVEELERHGCARFPDHAILMVGPLLIQFGTPAQKAFFLPRILSGEHIWCQGYSEPGAGSDLAGLRTRAVLDGDHWVVEGQKIWTTLAHTANWMFMLARTDPAAKPQEGISFLLLDMTSPGVTVRPIRNVMDETEFCEVFFDGVRVPKDNLVGAPNEGWTMAKALLGFERIFLGNPRQPGFALARLRLLAERLGKAADPETAARLAELRLDVADLTAAFREFVAVMSAGGDLGPEISWLKVWSTDTYQRITDRLVEVADDQGSLRDGIGVGDATVEAMYEYLKARRSTIVGGTNEIQRNVIAKTVLGLPSR